MASPWQEALVASPWQEALVASPWQGTLWWHHPGRMLHDGIALAGCSAVAQPWQGTLQGRGCGGSRVTPRAPPQPPGAAAGLVPPAHPQTAGLLRPPAL